MIAIVDYGMGNLKNIYKALKYVKAECKITSDRSEILSSDGVVLPGVGGFKDAMQCIREKGLDDAILASINTGKPFLGICLGMQMLFEKSFEGGEHKGLGFFKGSVKLIEGDVKVPHMGWNSIDIKKYDPLFFGIKNPVVYFVHSYHCVPDDLSIVSSNTVYGSNITASVFKDNVFGVQFHPEKSGDVGLKILDNFRRMVK